MNAKKIQVRLVLCSRKKQNDFITTESVECQEIESNRHCSLKTSAHSPLIIPLVSVLDLTRRDENDDLRDQFLKLKVVGTLKYGKINIFWVFTLCEEHLTIKNLLVEATSWLLKNGPRERSYRDPFLCRWAALRKKIGSDAFLVLRRIEKDGAYLLNIMPCFFP